MKMDFNFDDFFKSLDWSKVAVKDGAAEGMHDATDDLLSKSRDLAPLSDGGGTLRRTSGKNVEVSGDEVSGEVYFSATERDKNGEVYNYALITHELGDSFKNPSTPGTQPKYLERPMKENAERYKQMVADSIRRELS
ncbi:hypothetical protein [Paenibacillus terrigena]|uniref:hypothetical protein n=1 Tax=Paenibacillus terrigena TaxID=369333 RepID=UPI0028D64EA4|nr:hypothetical protein [Paenibacillus terrigena]